MLKGNRKWLLFLACAALSVPATAGDLTLGGEGYTFTLRDTDNSTGPPYKPLDLSGLGWRARASLTWGGGAQRISLVVQRTRDDVHESWRYRYSSYEYLADTRLAFVSVDARYEPRVSASERFELRAQTGYRFAHGAQTVRRSSRCLTCPAPSDWSLDQDRLTGHGIRAGLAGDLRLAGPLHLENEAGLSLLAATGTEVDAHGYEHRPPYSSTRERRRGSATWDLSVRLRAEWKGVSVSVGYRFDRWTPVRWLGSDLGTDGFTFGLGLRFGL